MSGPQAPTPPAPSGPSETRPATPPSEPAPAPAPPPAPASPLAPPAPPILPGSPPGAAPRLTLIGAGHVFQVEAAIHEAIAALRPDIVFIELDRKRLEGLVQRRQAVAPPEPAGGFVHKRLARFQEGVAGLFGADVGSEMLGAVSGARAVGARLSLVDDDAEAMLHRALKGLTWRERLRIAGMILAGGAKSLWPPARRNAKKEVERQLREYQADPAGTLAELRAKLPTVHRILIEERDARMAGRIRRQLAGLRHGVAVLGDGHVNGMLPQLADLRPKVYRLADVREGRLPRLLPPATGTTTRIGFSVMGRTPPGPEPVLPPPGWPQAEARS